MQVQGAGHAVGRSSMRHVFHEHVAVVFVAAAAAAAAAGGEFDDAFEG